MDELIQYWPRRKSFLALGFGLFFVCIALDIRFWGFLGHLADDGGGFLFWLFLLAGGAAMFGSVAGLARPSLVLAADSSGIKFGGLARRNAHVVHVPWEQIQSVDVGTYSIQTTRHQPKRSVVAMRIECDPAVSLTGCGDGVLFLVGTSAEIDDRTNWQSDINQSRLIESGRPRNIALIGSTYFDDSIVDVSERLAAMRSVACEDR